MVPGHCRSPVEWRFAMLTAPTLAFLVAWSTLAVLPNTKFGRTVLDIPNERSLHTSLVPRIGGVGIAAGISAAAMTITDIDPVLGWAALGYVLLFIVSLVDDIWSLPVLVRLVAHLLAAVAWVWAIALPLIWTIPAVLAMVWMTNLFNFMDGADGLAGGMTVFGFGTLAAAALSSGQLALAALCLGVAASALGFLVFNFHPASIFMGDSGSIPIGFLAGAIGLYGAQYDVWPVLLPIFAFFPFVFDATYTLVARLVRAHKPWQAHREHIYQRLVQSGLGHKRVAALAYACMALCALCALVSPRLSLIGQSALLAVMTLVSIGLATRISRIEPRQLR